MLTLFLYLYIIAKKYILILPILSFNIKSTQVYECFENRPYMSDNGMQTFQFDDLHGSLLKEFKISHKYYEDIIKKYGIFSQKVIC